MFYSPVTWNYKADRLFITETVDRKPQTAESRLQFSAAFPGSAQFTIAVNEIKGTLKWPRTFSAPATLTNQ